MPQSAARHEFTARYFVESSVPSEKVAQVIAGEQSSRNWGWCRQQNRDLRELPLAQRAVDMWSRLNEELGAETGFRRTGLVYVTTSQPDLDRWVQWVDKAREIAATEYLYLD